MKKTIAITGGIGSGKSTVSNILKRKGYPVFSCDEIYGELLYAENFKELIAKSFPACLINGEIDRKALASIIFNDTNKRNQLNSLTHPLIMQSLFEKIQAVKEEWVFAEIPLLFENGFEKDFDFTIVVMRSEKSRIQSVKERSGLNEREILARMAAQFDYDKAFTKGEFDNSKIYVLFNDNTIEALEKSIENLLNKLRL